MISRNAFRTPIPKFCACSVLLGNNTVVVVVVVGVLTREMQRLVYDVATTSSVSLAATESAQELSTTLACCGLFQVEGVE
jgi:hypothetical protein